MTRPGLVLALAIAASPASAQSHRFLEPTKWTTGFSVALGWGPDHPRMLADVDGDGRQDIVGFGYDGTAVGRSNGTSFVTYPGTEGFGYTTGWRSSRHVRTTARLNDDTRADLVGFGDAGVYRALSGEGALGPAELVLAGFGHDQGWRVENHERLLGDINRDGFDDIVGFGDDGVFLSLSTGFGGFLPPSFEFAALGYNHGWRRDRHVRVLADVNGDGGTDIVAFGEDDVSIALSNGSGFAPPQAANGSFCFADGWRVHSDRRFVVDIDDDGKSDIVGMGRDGVWIARSNGAGFDSARLVINHFGSQYGFTEPRNWRAVADLNGDGDPELVGIGDEGVIRSLHVPWGFESPRAILRAMALAGGHPPQYYLAMARAIGDVDADGYQDLVVFGPDGVDVACSKPSPPPPPPPTPTEVTVTQEGPYSLDFKWNDNSNDERNLYIRWAKDGEPDRYATLPPNTTRFTIGPLDPSSRYCLDVQAESLWGISSRSLRSCRSTTPQPAGTHIVLLQRDPASQYPYIYRGSWGPVSNYKPVRLWLDATATRGIAFLKFGHVPEECGDYNSPIVGLLPDGSVSGGRLQDILGLSPAPSDPVTFLACGSASDIYPDVIPFNLDFAP